MRSTHSPPSYIDVVLVVLGAPLLLLVGVPALGYAIGAASWIILRAVGVAVDRHASAGANVVQQLSLRIEISARAGTGARCGRPRGKSRKGRRVSRTAGDHTRVHRPVDLVALCRATSL
jgi:hypothetical protein